MRDIDENPTFSFLFIDILDNTRKKYPFFLILYQVQQHILRLSFSFLCSPD